jgi:hypothetical protein
MIKDILGEVLPSFQEEIAPEACSCSCQCTTRTGSSSGATKAFDGGAAIPD